MGKNTKNIQIMYSVYERYSKVKIHSHTNWAHFIRNLMIP